MAGSGQAPTPYDGMGTPTRWDIRTQDESTTEEQLRDCIVYLSPRRRAVRLYQALGLPPPVLPPLDMSKAPKPIEPEQKVRGVAAQRLGRPRKPSLSAVQPKRESVDG